MMKSTVLFLSALHLASAAPQAPSGRVDRMTEEDLKENPKLRSLLDERLGEQQQNERKAYGSGYTDAYGWNFYADSSDIEYDGYQQAWRYLGWYVACGTPSDRYNDNGSHHSHDNGSWMGNNYCQRYLMWAGVSTCKYRTMEINLRFAFSNQHFPPLST